MQANRARTRPLQYTRWSEFRPEGRLKGIVNIESRPLRRTFFVEPESGPADSCSSTDGDSLDLSKAGDESVRGSAGRNSRRAHWCLHLRYRLARYSLTRHPHRTPNGIAI